MSNPISATKAGLALGGLLGLVHLGWSLLVLVGLAQPLMDGIFQLHMVRPPYTIGPFSITAAIGLIAATFLFGFILGNVFALVWNFVSKR